MRAAFIIYGKADKRSGGYLYDSFLIKSLESRGHVVKVFPQKERTFAGKIFENSIKKFKDLIDFNPDVIIEDELNHPSLFLINRKLKLLTAATVIAVVHHLRSEEKLRYFFRILVRGIEYLFLKSCDAFIFNSESTKESIVRLFNNDKFESVVVYPGKDNLPLEERKKRNADTVNFLFAGNIIPRKNPDLVLKALKKMPDKNWKFFICGEGQAESRYYKDLKLSASDLVKNGRVEFTGRVDDSRLSSLISESDFLIVPSDWEGFGIIYLEAMRGGAVPIASNQGGACEIIDDRINGFLIAAEDEIFLENLLQTIIENNGIIAEMRDNGLKKAESFLSWEKTMENAVKFIEKCSF